MSEPIKTNELTQNTEVAPAHEETTGGLGMLGINGHIFLAQLFNFLVVLLVLWKWVYTPLVRLLDERSKRIEESMKHAEDIEKRVKVVEADHARLMHDAKAEAAAMLEQARTEAESRKKELLEAAKADVQKIVTQGKEQLKAEKAIMLREAKMELVDIAIAAATKVLKESVSEKASQKLAQDVVDKMV